MKKYINNRESITNFNEETLTNDCENIVELSAANELLKDVLDSSGPELRLGDPVDGGVTPGVRHRFRGDVNADHLSNTSSLNT
jgi:hypothetical protein